MTVIPGSDRKTDPGALPRSPAGLGTAPGSCTMDRMMGDQRASVHDSQGQAPREAHCVLWHAQNLPASAELRAALDRRGMIVHTCEERALALGELCKLRGPREPGAEAVPSGRALILVFVEPDRLRRPDELKEVLDRYAPRTALWMYRSAGNPQLRAVTEQDVQRWRAQRPAPQPRVAASIKSPAVWAEAKVARKGPAPVAPVAPMIVGPRLKLAGEVRPAALSVTRPVSVTPPVQERPPAAAGPAPVGEAVEPKEATPGGGTADIRQLLSEEELAMLLAGGAKSGKV